MSESSVGSNPTLSADVETRALGQHSSLLERPDIVGTDLGEIAKGVIEIDR